MTNTTTLQAAEKTVFTGYEALELLNQNISVAEKGQPNVEYFKGDDGVFKKLNHRTAQLAHLAPELAEFLTKEFVKYAEPLKVGDFVKVVKGNNLQSKVGDVLELHEKQGHDGFRAKHLNGKDAGFKYGYNLVRATDEEVQTAQQARLVVGGFAKVISNEVTAKHIGSHQFPIGEIIKLDDTLQNFDGFRASFQDGHDWWNVFRKDLLPLTAEEVAQMEQEEKDRKEKAEKEAAAKKLREQQDALVEGEFAKIIGNVCNHRFPMGEIVKLSRVQADGFRADYLDGHDFWYVKRVDLAPVTKAERKRAMLKNIRRGDYLKVLVRGFNTNVHVGDFVKVLRNDESTIPFEIATLDGKNIGWIPAGDVEKATPAQVKEAKAKLEEERKEKELREKWEAVGRKVGEIKRGDIVRITALHGASKVSIGDLVEAMDGRGDGDFHDKKHGYILTGELVVPVEKRFDAKG